jgi:hypothetical protein
MTDKTHWKQLINPNFIGAYALPNGQDLTVTISYVQREHITVEGGKKEECSVAYLVEQKPMILNVTNSKTIAKLYGPYVEDWAGKQVTLYASTTKMGGETVECLRIRSLVADRVLPSITDNRLKKAIQSIRKGEYTAQKVEANFLLTLAQKQELDGALAAMAGDGLEAVNA